MNSKEPLVVHKFGGSCLLDDESYSKTLAIMRKFSGMKSVAVLSAFKGVTDKLIKLLDLSLEDKDEALDFAKEIKDFHRNVVERTIKDEVLREDGFTFLDEKFAILEKTIPEIFENGLPRDTRDFVISFGERLSTYLFALFLKQDGLDVLYFSGEELITTNPNFGNALPLMEKTRAKIERRMVPQLRAGKTCLVTGFYGETEDGAITTLGRGGTDFTTTIIANVLSDFFDVRVVFWKDVDGLLTANPNIEPEARLIEMISYEEANELAYFGSKVLHPLCLKMTREKEIPVEIRNFNKDLDASFTTISALKEETNEIVKSIACISRCTMITVQGAAMVSLPGFAARLFGTLAEHQINILFISQASSENNITFVVDASEGEHAMDALKSSKFFGDTDDAHWIDLFSEEAALVAIVGHGMAYRSGISGRIFTALGNAGVNVRAIAQGSSELNISIIIAPADLEKAVHAIHDGFNLSR